ncbi:hypothetical protein AAFG13_35775 [Bradyrhizobium sp. B124]|uniref:hypothetical protein n=1 Tax=Bradyrhizobium sp. B124 TaxID=3140245 RepID=UPI00318362ED
MIGAKDPLHLGGRWAIGQALKRLRGTPGTVVLRRGPLGFQLSKEARRWISLSGAVFNLAISTRQAMSSILKFAPVGTIFFGESLSIIAELIASKQFGKEAAFDLPLRISSRWS